MKLYLLRHTPPLPEVAGQCYGRLDVPVDEGEVVACATRWRAQLAPGIAVWSSPATRCRQLATCFDPQHRVDIRLREMDFGAWEGLSWETIPRPELDAWAADVVGFTPPGGESARAVQQRALDFVHTLISDSLLVTHAGVIRALLAHWQGLPDTDWLTIRPAFGQLIEVMFEVASPGRAFPVSVTALPV